VLHVSLRNLGGYCWTRVGSGHTQLRVSLLSKDGGILQRDFRAISLPSELPPGGSIAFDASVLAPDIAGDYQLRFDMVHEQVCWFSDTRPCSVDLDIQVH